MTWIARTDGLTAADVMHPQLSSMPPSATLADARRWFAASGSRRLASRRLPVVDATGALRGIVAIDKRRERFCGAG